MRVDYDVIRNLESAARRHRAEAVAGLITTAFARVLRRLSALRMGASFRSSHVQGRPAQG